MPAPTGVFYPSLAVLLASTRSFPAGVEIAAGSYRYVAAAAAARDHHLTTAGGAKIYFQRSNSSVSPEAFGATGDGVTDDIVALERWRDYVEAHNLIGVFDGRTYLVSRTLYLRARATYQGCDGTLLKAAADFATNFTDPKADALAGGLAPVLFFDGRIEAIGEPNRRVGLSSLRIDCADVAAHGLIAAGVGAGSMSKIYVDNATVANFVICGIQNAIVEDLKGMAGSSGALPSQACLWIMNGTKNSVFISCDMAAAQEVTPALVRIGTCADYPGPGASKALIAEEPNQITFIKGVFESQGNSGEPLRAIWIEAGVLIHFIDLNMALAPSVAMVEVAAGVKGARLIGGRSNGQGCTVPLLINAGRDVVLDRHDVLNFSNDSCLIENNGSGRVVFNSADNGLFGGFSSVFGGSAAHHQNRLGVSRWYGDAAARAAERADQATGTPWWDAERNIMTWWVNGAALNADGMRISTGTADAKSWPVLGDAHVSGGVLDLKGYSKATLKLTAPTSITGMTAQQAGQMVVLVCDNGNATFTSGSGLKLTDRAPSVNPQSRDAISFGRVNGSNLTGGISEWVQTSGPVGLATAPTAALASAANAINTNGKRAGKFCRNSTDNKLYAAAGAATTSAWIAADGATTITPV